MPGWLLLEIRGVVDNVRCTIGIVRRSLLEKLPPIYHTGSAFQGCVASPGPEFRSPELGVQKGPAVGSWNRLANSPLRLELVTDHFRLLCGLGVWAVAAFNLVIWIIGGKAPSILRPDEITMAPITATCLMLVGTSLLCDVPCRRPRGGGADWEWLAPEPWPYSA